MTLCILGAGPRGLAVALQAVNQGIQTFLIDPDPGHSWTPPQTISQFTMRSPITFDLVLGQPELARDSLAFFVGERTWEDPNIDLSLAQLEMDPRRCNREVFYMYLQAVIQRLNQAPNLTLIRATPTIITPTCVEVLNNGEPVKINYKGLVIALGTTLSDPIEPAWAKQSQLRNIKRSPGDAESLTGERVVIIGNGQNAAEYASFLGARNEVRLLCLRNWRVTMYPGPVTADWGAKGIFSSYYRGLLSAADRADYLKAVSNWQPSVTPEVDEELKHRNVQVLLSTDEVCNDTIEWATAYFPMAGSRVGLQNIPTGIRIPRSTFNPDWPALRRGFSLSNRPNWFFTGVSAIDYDGPRQASLFSAAATAKEIIHAYRRL